MNSCHDCPHAALIKAHEMDGIPWEQTPCSRCKLVEDSFGTREFIEERGGPVGRPGDGVTPRDDLSEEEASMPMSVLADSLRLFLSLPRDALDVIVMRYQGLPYKEIGRQLGVTASAAEVRHKRVMNQLPVLKTLYPEKVVRQRRRRSMARRGKPGAGASAKAEGGAGKG